MYSPYAPPAAPPDDQGQHGPARYRSLGGLTTAVTIAIVTCVLMQLATNALVMPISRLPEDSSLRAVFTFATIPRAIVHLVAIVLFLVWQHRAAKNLRAFGQPGLEFSPGWCVGWWFVPIAMYWKPFQAMKELWRASDPETIGANERWVWLASPLAPTMGWWWAAWIISNFVQRIAGKIGDPSTAVATGIVGALVSGLAAHLLVPIMRELAARQDASWAKLQARHASHRAYDDYRAA